MRLAPWSSSLLTLALGCQQFTVDKPPEDPPAPPPVCEWTPPPTETRPANPLCAPVEEPPGGFRPIIEWGARGNANCTSLPVVGDIDLDGEPEVIANFTGLLPGTKGDLVVMRGTNGREKWRVSDIMGYGNSPALADLDDDGYPEIVVVLQKKAGLVGIGGEYAVGAYDHQGNKLWETGRYPSLDFDYSAAPVISDMDHDGSPEIVVGRVIFSADGTERGKGIHGRGSFGVPPIGGVLSEGGLPAVADLDLDGVEEVIVGDARYAPDGTVLWHDDRQLDGLVAVVNLDDDPQGELAIASSNRVRFQDDDGRILWGPTELQNANITSVPTVGDIDGDGRPEVIVAGGNQLLALNHDGSELWSLPVQDLSGATGASIFDFEGDGVPEVVYIDEIQMLAADGRTGQIKFFTDEHSSATMYDYPVIADVDGDDHAEVVVCHDGFGSPLSVFGDEDNSWRPARRLWNQHAYTVTNVADNLAIPTTQPYSWQVHNTYHSAITESVSPDGAPLEGPFDVAAEILGFCDASCLGEQVELYARLANLSPGALPGGTVTLSLYAIVGGQRILVGSQAVASDLGSGETGGDVTFLVPVQVAIDAEGFELVADDLGGGIGILTECAEANNVASLQGALCLPGDND
jgi:hypothetical protein